jgi:hypothetical protein
MHHKRKAAESPMGSPGPPQKKKRRPSPVETKLEALQNTLAGLVPTWATRDPGTFMELMRHMQKRIDGLTPDTIEHFTGTETDNLLEALDKVDEGLLGETPSMGSQPLKKTDSDEKMRTTMRNYVGDVRGSLEGQSQARILSRC